MSTRPPVAAAALLLTVLVTPAAHQAFQGAGAPPAVFDHRLIDRYCVGCHNPRTQCRLPRAPGPGRQPRR